MDANKQNYYNALQALQSQQQFSPGFGSHALQSQQQFSPGFGSHALQSQQQFSPGFGSYQYVQSNVHNDSPYSPGISIIRSQTIVRHRLSSSISNHPSAWKAGHTPPSGGYTYMTYPQQLYGSPHLMSCDPQGMANQIPTTVESSHLADINMFHQDYSYTNVVTQDTQSLPFISAEFKKCMTFSSDDHQSMTQLQDMSGNAVSQHKVTSEDKHDKGSVAATKNIDGVIPSTCQSIPIYEIKNQFLDSKAVQNSVLLQHALNYIAKEKAAHHVDVKNKSPESDIISSSQSENCSKRNKQNRAASQGRGGLETNNLCQDSESVLDLSRNKNRNNDSECMSSTTVDTGVDSDFCSIMHQQSLPILPGNISTDNINNTYSELMQSIAEKVNEGNVHSSSDRQLLKDDLKINNDDVVVKVRKSIEKKLGNRKYTPVPQVPPNTEGRFRKSEYIENLDKSVVNCDTMNRSISSELESKTKKNKSERLKRSTSSQTVGCKTKSSNKKGGVKNEIETQNEKKKQTMYKDCEDKNVCLTNESVPVKGQPKAPARNVHQILSEFESCVSTENSHSKDTCLKDRRSKVSDKNIGTTPTNDTTGYTKERRSREESSNSRTSISDKHLDLKVKPDDHVVRKYMIPCLGEMYVVTVDKNGEVKSEKKRKKVHKSVKEKSREVSSVAESLKNRDHSYHQEMSGLDILSEVASCISKANREEDRLKCKTAKRLFQNLDNDTLKDTKNRTGTINVKPRKATTKKESTKSEKSKLGKETTRKERKVKTSLTRNNDQKSMTECSKSKAHIRKPLGDHNYAKNDENTSYLKKLLQLTEREEETETDQDLPKLTSRRSRQKKSDLHRSTDKEDFLSKTKCKTKVKSHGQNASRLPFIEVNQNLPHTKSSALVQLPKVSISQSVSNSENSEKDMPLPILKVTSIAPISAVTKTIQCSKVPDNRFRVPLKEMCPNLSAILSTVSQGTSQQKTNVSQTSHFLSQQIQENMPSAAVASAMALQQPNKIMMSTSNVLPQQSARIISKSSNCLSMPMRANVSITSDCLSYPASSKFLIQSSDAHITKASNSTSQQLAINLSTASTQSQSKQLSGNMSAASTFPTSTSGANMLKTSNFQTQLIEANSPSQQSSVNMEVATELDPYTYRDYPRDVVAYEDLSLFSNGSQLCKSNINSANQVLPLVEPTVKNLNPITNISVPGFNQKRESMTDIQNMRLSRSNFRQMVYDKKLVPSNPEPQSEKELITKPYLPVYTNPKPHWTCGRNLLTHLDTPVFKSTHHSSSTLSTEPFLYTNVKPFMTSTTSLCTSPIPCVLEKNNLKTFGLKSLPTNGNKIVPGGDTMGKCFTSIQNEALDLRVPIGIEHSDRQQTPTGLEHYGRGKNGREQTSTGIEHNSRQQTPTGLEHNGRENNGRLQTSTGIEHNSRQQIPTKLEHNGRKQTPTGLENNNREQTLAALEHNSREQTSLGLEHNTIEQTPTELEHNNREQTPAALEHNSREQTPAALEHNNREQTPAALEHNSREQTPAALEHNSREQTPAALEHNSREQILAGIEHNGREKIPTGLEHNSRKQILAGIEHNGREQMPARLEHSSREQINSFNNNSVELTSGDYMETGKSAEINYENVVNMFPHLSKTAKRRQRRRENKRKRELLSEFNRVCVTDGEDEYKMARVEDIKPSSNSADGNKDQVISDTETTSSHLVDRQDAIDSDGDNLNVAIVTDGDVLCNVNNNNNKAKMELITEHKKSEIVEEEHVSSIRDAGMFNDMAKTVNSCVIEKNGNVQDNTRTLESEKNCLSKLGFPSLPNNNNEKGDISDPTCPFLDYSIVKIHGQLQNEPETASLDYSGAGRDEETIIYCEESDTSTAETVDYYREDDGENPVCMKYSLQSLDVDMGDQINTKVSSPLRIDPELSIDNVSPFKDFDDDNIADTDFSSNFHHTDFDNILGYPDSLLSSNYFDEDQNDIPFHSSPIFTKTWHDAPDSCSKFKVDNLLYHPIALPMGYYSDDADESDDNIDHQDENGEIASIAQIMLKKAHKSPHEKTQTFCQWVLYRLDEVKKPCHWQWLTQLEVEKWKTFEESGQMSPTLQKYVTTIKTLRCLKDRKYERKNEVQIQQQSCNSKCTQGFSDLNRDSLKTKTPIISENTTSELRKVTYSSALQEIKDKCQQTVTGQNAHKKYPGFRIKLPESAASKLQDVKPENRTKFTNTKITLNKQTNDGHVSGSFPATRESVISGTVLCEVTGMFVNIEEDSNIINHDSFNPEKLTDDFPRKRADKSLNGISESHQVDIRQIPEKSCEGKIVNDNKESTVPVFHTNNKPVPHDALISETTKFTVNKQGSTVSIAATKQPTGTATKNIICSKRNTVSDIRTESAIAITKVITRTTTKVSGTRSSCKESSVAEIGIPVLEAVTKFVKDAKMLFSEARASMPNKVTSVLTDKATSLPNKRKPVLADKATSLPNKGTQVLADKATSLPNKRTPVLTEKATSLPNKGTLVLADKATPLPNKGTQVSADKAALLSNKGTPVLADKPTPLSNKGTPELADKPTPLSNKGTPVLADKPTPLPNKGTPVSADKATSLPNKGTPVLADKPTPLSNKGTPVLADKPTPLSNKGTPVLADKPTPLPNKGTPVSADKATSLPNKGTPVSEDKATSMSNKPAQSVLDKTSSFSDKGTLTTGHEAIADKLNKNECEKQNPGVSVQDARTHQSSSVKCLNESLKYETMDKAPGTPEIPVVKSAKTKKSPPLTKSTEASLKCDSNKGTLILVKPMATVTPLMKPLDTNGTSPMIRPSETIKSATKSPVAKGKPFSVKPLAKVSPVKSLEAIGKSLSTECVTMEIAQSATCSNKPETSPSAKCEETIRTTSIETLATRTSNTSTDKPSLATDTLAAKYEETPHSEERLTMGTSVKAMETPRSTSNQSSFLDTDVPGYTKAAMIDELNSLSGISVENTGNCDQISTKVSVSSITEKIMVVSEVPISQGKPEVDNMSVTLQTKNMALSTENNDQCVKTDIFVTKCQPKESHVIRKEIEILTKDDKKKEIMKNSTTHDTKSEKVIQVNSVPGSKAINNSNENGQQADTAGICNTKDGDGGKQINCEIMNKTKDGSETELYKNGEYTMETKAKRKTVNLLNKLSQEAQEYIGCSIDEKLNQVRPKKLPKHLQADSSNHRKELLISYRGKGYHRDSDNGQESKIQTSINVQSASNDTQNMNCNLKCCQTEYDAVQSKSPNGPTGELVGQRRKTKTEKLSAGIEDKKYETNVDKEKSKNKCTTSNGKEDSEETVHGEIESNKNWENDQNHAKETRENCNDTSENENMRDVNKKDGNKNTKDITKKSKCNDEIINRESKKKSEHINEEEKVTPCNENSTDKEFMEMCNAQELKVLNIDDTECVDGSSVSKSGDISQTMVTSDHGTKKRGRKRKNDKTNSNLKAVKKSKAQKVIRIEEVKNNGSKSDLDRSIETGSEFITTKTKARKMLKLDFKEKQSVETSNDVVQNTDNTNVTSKKCKIRTFNKEQSINHDSKPSQDSAVTMETMPSHNSNVTIELKSSHGRDVTMESKSPHDSNVAMELKSSHDSDVTMELKSSHDSDVTMELKSSHDSDVTMELKSSHDSDVTMELKSSHDSDVTMELKSSHDSDVTMELKSSHDSDVTMELKSSHDSDVTMELKSSHDSDVTMELKSSHDSDVTMELKSSHDSDVTIGHKTSNDSGATMEPKSSHDFNVTKVSSDESDDQHLAATIDSTPMKTGDSWNITSMRSCKVVLKRTRVSPRRFKEFYMGKSLRMHREREDMAFKTRKVLPSKLKYMGKKFNMVENTESKLSKSTNKETNKVRKKGDITQSAITKTTTGNVVTKATAGNVKFRIVTDRTEQVKIKRNKKLLCKFCKQRIPKCNLMAHAQSQHPWRCVTCTKVFDSRAARKLHYAEYHTGDELHTCMICRINFRYLRTMERHRKSHVHRQLARLQTDIIGLIRGCLCQYNIPSISNQAQTQGKLSGTSFLPLTAGNAPLLENKTGTVGTILSAIDSDEVKVQTDNEDHNNQALISKTAADVVPVNSANVSMNSCTTNPDTFMVTLKRKLSNGKEVTIKNFLHYEPGLREVIQDLEFCLGSVQQSRFRGMMANYMPGVPFDSVETIIDQINVVHNMSAGQGPSYLQGNMGAGTGTPYLHGNMALPYSQCPPAILSVPFNQSESSRNDSNSIGCLQSEGYNITENKLSSTDDLSSLNLSQINDFDMTTYDVPNETNLATINTSGLNLQQENLTGLDPLLSTTEHVLTNEMECTMKTSDKEPSPYEWLTRNLQDIEDDTLIPDFLLSPLKGLENEDSYCKGQRLQIDQNEADMTSMQKVLLDISGNIKGDNQVGSLFSLHDSNNNSSNLDLQHTYSMDVVDNVGNSNLDILTPSNLEGDGNKCMDPLQVTTMSAIQQEYDQISKDIENDVLSYCDM